MAKENNMLGVVYVGLGEPGDGVMPAKSTLTEFTDVEVASVTIEGSQTNETNISTEAEDAYLTVDATADPTSVVLRLFGVTPTQRILLMGGSVNDVVGDELEGMWMAPVTKEVIHLSLRTEGKEIKGKKGVFVIPYGKVSARDQGTITKDGLPAIEVTITANTPVSAAGLQGPPYAYGSIAVV